MTDAAEGQPLRSAMGAPARAHQAFGLSVRVAAKLMGHSVETHVRHYGSWADADTIETFLDARAADNAAFDWSPPDETATYKWICSSWTKTLPYSNLATIRTTFTQVFEP